MTTLRHTITQGTHNFLLETGTTKLGSPAGVWCNYTIPTKTQPGVLMMLYATQESRHYVPAMLGVLGLHSLNTYGELPVGSPDLSSHSIRIQNKLAPLIGQLPHDAVLNKENWFSSIRNIRAMSSLFNSKKSDTLDLDLLRQGKDFVLQVLSGEAVQMELPFYLEG
jgi:hypothetical protein